MQRETIHYEADGLSMQGQLFLPAGSGPFSAVLVFPEAFGIGPNSIARAERLAELGYVALACDLHGNSRFIDRRPEAMAALRGLFDDPLLTRARALAALDALAARPEVDPTRVAAIGFCFPMPLELARSGADLKATIGFHTGLKTRLPAVPGSIRGAILACLGGDDPHIPSADRAAFEAEMRAACCVRRLAAQRLWQHRAQLHQPRRGLLGAARRDPLQCGVGRAVVGRDDRIACAGDQIASRK